MRKLITAAATLFAAGVLILGSPPMTLSAEETVQVIRVDTNSTGEEDGSDEKEAALAAASPKKMLTVEVTEITSEATEKVPLASMAITEETPTCSTHYLIYVAIVAAALIYAFRVFKVTRRISGIRSGLGE